MKLLEFFGKPIEVFDVESKTDDKDEKFKLAPEEKSHLEQDVFEFIINNDDLHKKFFLPLAMKISKQPTKLHHPKIWLPMVNKGCLEFYRENKMLGDPLDIFDKELRATLCKKCADHHHKNILIGEYDLGL